MVSIASLPSVTPLILPVASFFVRQKETQGNRSIQEVKFIQYGQKKVVILNISYSVLRQMIIKDVFIAMTREYSSCFVLITFLCVCSIWKWSNISLVLGDDTPLIDII